MWLVVVGNWCLLLVSALCIICLNSGCLVKKQPRISNISHRKGLDDEEAVLMGASVLELPMDESCAFLTLV